jgi:hypothetical protein
MTIQPVPILRFAREFTERDALEAQKRGYLSHVVADFRDGRLFPLFFYDVVRLQQDLEERIKHGSLFVADPGMIVVHEVTLEIMDQAVKQLGDEGYFDHLRPITEDELGSSNPYEWPPRPFLEANKQEGVRTR